MKDWKWGQCMCSSSFSFLFFRSVSPSGELVRQFQDVPRSWGELHQSLPHNTESDAARWGREQGSGPAGPVEPSTDCYSLTWVGWRCNDGCLFFFFFLQKSKLGSGKKKVRWAHFFCTKPQFIFTRKLVSHENAEHDATFMPCLSPFLFNWLSRSLRHLQKPV